MAASRVRRNPEDSVARSIVPALCLFLFMLPLSGVSAEEDERPWSEQPFIGLSVRDTKDGLIVAWVRPGPLGGRAAPGRRGRSHRPEGSGEPVPHGLVDVFARVERGQPDHRNSISDVREY